MRGGALHHQAKNPPSNTPIFPVGQGSEVVYARECFPVPGFSVSFTDPDAKRTEFGDYRSLCARWQNNVTVGLRAALQSKNYVQIRNALLILNTTVKVRLEPH